MLLAIGEEPVSTIPKSLDDMYQTHHAMVLRTAYRVTGVNYDAKAMTTSSPSVEFAIDDLQGYPGQHNHGRLFGSI